MSEWVLDLEVCVCVGRELYARHSEKVRGQPIWEGLGARDK